MSYCGELIFYSPVGVIQGIFANMSVQIIEYDFTLPLIEAGCGKDCVYNNNSENVIVWGTFLCNDHWTMNISSGRNARCCQNILKAHRKVNVLKMR